MSRTKDQKQKKEKMEQNKAPHNQLCEEESTRFGIILKESDTSLYVQKSVKI